MTWMVVGLLSCFPYALSCESVCAVDDEDDAVGRGEKLGQRTSPEAGVAGRIDNLDWLGQGCRLQLGTTLSGQKRTKPRLGWE